MELRKKRYATLNQLYDSLPRDHDICFKIDGKTIYRGLLNGWENGGTQEDIAGIASHWFVTSMRGKKDTLVIDMSYKGD